MIGSKDEPAWRMSQERRQAEADRELECAHCGEDIGVGGLPDSGGSCPVCHRNLCRRCAGGWCTR